MFRAIQLMLAGLRGSLYLAVLVTATIFAAATGIVGSSVTLLGVMAAPTMKRSGYDVRMSAGAITAGGTLGILIPPSIMLIVMGPVVGVPATDLFAAAVIPGLLLAGLYIVYTLVRCHINPAARPARCRWRSAPNPWVEVVRELVFGCVPIVIVIMATLGVILMGIATPTDAGAVGAFAVFLLTLAYRKLSWAGFKRAMMSTLEVSSMILLLVAASNFFGAVFSRLGSPHADRRIAADAELLADADAAADPRDHLRARLAARMGADRADRRSRSCCRWWTSSASTRSGSASWWRCACRRRGCRRRWRLSAYFLKGVVPDWDLKDIYLGMMQFMVLQVIGLLLVLAWPELALWLPRVLRD